MTQDHTLTEGDDGDFASIETPEELRPVPAVEGEPSETFPPALDRPRPQRAPIVARWVWITAAVVAGLFLIAAVTGAVFVNASKVTVPEVTGKTLSLATTNLKQAGLEAQVREERFSDRPKGEVLSQTPAAGEEARKGDAVLLVISAGTEEFPMPDVVGNGLSLARGTLESRGLAIEVEEIVSDAASGTVLSTIPAAGAPVRSGDVVRVMVAIPRPVVSGLEPYIMTGVSVLIDPAPVRGAGPDVPLEVARRLRALLEASGAVVTVMRSGVDTVTADADRARIASETSATVAVGFSVLPSGPLGRKASGSPASAQLRLKVVERLSAAAPPAAAETATADPVFASFKGPWIRVALGSLVQRADETSFADPRWADSVARAVYAALGEVYGKREGL